MEHACVRPVADNEGRTLRQVFQARGTDIGTGATYAARDFLDRLLHRSPMWNDDFRG